MSGGCVGADALSIGALRIAEKTAVQKQYNISTKIAQYQYIDCTKAVQYP